MKQILYKIFYGKPEYNKRLKETPYQAYATGLRKIWNNEKHRDIGFEKLLRLLLVSTQIFFPGIHIRQFFGRKGLVAKNTAVEFYVLFKTVLPAVFLFTGLSHYPGVVIISAYLLTETIFYVSSLIFVSDMFVRPRSYRRNILMLSFNYLEISLCFAVIYSGLHLLGDHNFSVTDYIYFSIVTSTTIGYGDMHPVSDFGKIMVCVQALLVFAFIVLFLNFFGPKVETLHNEDE